MWYRVNDRVIAEGLAGCSAAAHQPSCEETEGDKARTLNALSILRKKPGTLQDAKSEGTARVRYLKLETLKRVARDECVPIVRNCWLLYVNN